MTTTAPPIEDSTLHPSPRPDNIALGLSKGDPMKYLVVILAIALGVAGVVYGGIDDSPGGQLLGVLLIVGAVAVGVRMALRSR
jgi:hypothetical protein